MEEEGVDCFEWFDEGEILMVKKRYKWWVHYPGEVYANDMDWYEPVDEETARKRARRWLGVKRLPRGTEIWAGDK